MAKTTKGILGPFSGKIGPVIGSSWKNTAYIKAVPVQSTAKKSFTLAQLNQQEKFKFLNKWLEPFYSFLTIGFANLATNSTEINVAFSINYREALQGVAPNFTMDFAKVCLSRGQLQPLMDVVALRTGVNQLELQWPTQNSHAPFNDQLMLVVYCPALAITDGFIGLAQRGDGSVQFTFNSKMIGHPLQLYLSMVSLNRKKVSQSIYLGRMEP